VSAAVSNDNEHKSRGLPAAATGGYVHWNSVGHRITRPSSADEEYDQHQQQQQQQKNSKTYKEQ
jgi:hypothetical protein